MLFTIFFIPFHFSFVSIDRSSEEFWFSFVLMITLNASQETIKDRKFADQFKTNVVFFI